MSLTEKTAKAPVSRLESRPDEFAHPERHDFPAQPGVWERAVDQFGDMPVFPVGMLSFLSMAAYGIYRYRKMPLADPVARTLYFTGLRVAAQGVAVAIIVAGGAHSVWKDYIYKRDHNGETRPRHGF